jgi:hypothetical protein
MKNSLKSFLTALLVMVVLVLVVAIAPGRAPDVASVQASGLPSDQGGLINASVYPPLLTGATRYTTSLVTSPAVSIASYGDVQIMLSNVVTGSQTVTVTPQFSLQNLACASVTQWFTATTPTTYQPATMGTISSTVTITSGLAVSGTLITTNTTTITATMLSAGTPVSVALPDVFAVTGSGADAREINVQGQCLRVQLAFSNAGQSYTPTLTIRALNRN